jgi:ketosteroid isomerase-like protein
MERSDVDGWLDAYIEAWRSYEESAIAALFSEDVEYRYHPYDEPLRGRDAVVESWIGDQDDDGTYDASYRTVALDGDVAVATGSSSYAASPGGPVEKVYDNCFVMRFDADGRCSEFTEWFILRPS